MSHHHPHHTPKKSIPSDFPPSNLQDKVIVLAKINLVRSNTFSFMCKSITQSESRLSLYSSYKNFTVVKTEFLLYSNYEIFVFNLSNL